VDLLNHASFISLLLDPFPKGYCPHEFYSIMKFFQKRLLKSISNSICQCKIWTRGPFMFTSQVIWTRGPFRQRKTKVDSLRQLIGFWNNIFHVYDSSHISLCVYSASLILVQYKNGLLSFNLFVNYKKKSFINVRSVLNDKIDTIVFHLGYPVPFYLPRTPITKFCFLGIKFSVELQINYHIWCGIL
jgi:hypothetical protein